MAHTENIPVFDTSMSEISSGLCSALEMLQTYGPEYKTGAVKLSWCVDRVNDLTLGMIKNEVQEFACLVSPDSKTPTVFSINFVFRLWGAVCSLLCGLKKTNKPLFSRMPCVAIARSHNFFGWRFLSKCAEIYPETIEFLISEFNPYAEHYKNLVIIITPGQLVGDRERSMVMIRNFTEWEKGPLGAFMQITVRRLVSGSSLRQFPRELIRGVLESLVGR